MRIPFVNVSIELFDSQEVGLMAIIPVEWRDCIDYAFAGVAIGSWIVLHIVCFFVWRVRIAVLLSAFFNIQSPRFFFSHCSFLFYVVYSFVSKFVIAYIFS
jgi:hypothetical protein